MSISAANLSNDDIETTASRQLLNNGTVFNFFDALVMRVNAELATFVAAPHKNLCEKAFLSRLLLLKLFYVDDWLDNSTAIRYRQQILVEKVTARTYLCVYVRLKILTRRLSACSERFQVFHRLLMRILETKFLSVKGVGHFQI